jgi:predicted peptidase
MKSLLFIFLLLQLRCWGQDFSAYEKYEYNNYGFNLPYRFLKPLGNDSSNKYPLVIFLHGAAHKGTDNEVQLNIGGNYFLRDSIRNKYPAFVLFPQCPITESWAYFDVIFDSVDRRYIPVFPYRKNPEPPTLALLKLIDSLIEHLNIDRNRVYIGGLSQGAMGVLDIIARDPGTFTAAFSICGGGDINNSKRFSGSVALWLFHGEDDDVIPYSFSQNYFKKLQRLHADVRFTSYPGVKHNSWINAFQEPDLVSWLFSKRKNTLGRSYKN